MKNTKQIDILLGNYLKAARLKKGYTLQQVADKLGSNSRATISNYESGNRTMSLKILLKLCKIYDIDANDLFNTIVNLI